MGIWSGIVGFGVGYAVGRTTSGGTTGSSLEGTGRGRATAQSFSLSGVADRLRATIGGVATRTVDVRQVRDVMTPVPETVSPTATLRDAAAAMERADVGDVLVVDGDDLRGILTDRDIAIRAVGGGRDISTTVVADVFTPSVVSISPTSAVQEAIELMRKHDVRRLPVVEAGRPIGVVSLGDLAVAREPASLLSDITTAPPNT
jgi:CBS domain-containing protein